MNDLKRQTADPSQVERDPDDDSVSEELWEAVVSSGDYIIWRSERRWTSPDAAQHQGSVTMCGGMRPTAYQLSGGGWRACIVIRQGGEPGESHINPFLADIIFPAMIDAWRHAAQLLASAETSVHKSLSRDCFVAARPQKPL